MLTAILFIFVVGVGAGPLVSNDRSSVQEQDGRRHA